MLIYAFIHLFIYLFIYYYFLPLDTATELVKGDSSDCVKQIEFVIIRSKRYVREKSYIGGKEGLIIFPQGNNGIFHYVYLYYYYYLFIISSQR